MNGFFVKNRLLPPKIPTRKFSQVKEKLIYNACFKVYKK